jgi:hypothetical protein
MSGRALLELRRLDMIHYLRLLLLLGVALLRLLDSRHGHLSRKSRRPLPGVNTGYIGQ